MKLPYDWHDFKIVETTEGCFTGQIKTDLVDEFDEEKRRELVRYTREYIEACTGNRVEQWQPNLRDRYE